MQALVPVGTANPNSRSGADITAAIAGRSGSRKFTFRYDLLTSANVYKSAITNMTSASVALDWQSDIKRTATFTLTDLGGIDFLSDRIKPWIRLHLAPYGALDYVEWPLGVFLLSTPSRSVDEDGVVIREVQGYDALQIFTDDKVTARYTAAAGSVVTTLVSTLLGSITQNVTVSSSVLPIAKEWEPGTPKLTIINELLAQINYDSLFFDEVGTAIVKPYVAPSVRAEEWTFADDTDSIILTDVEQTLDLFSVPNRWTIVVEDPDRIALISTYTNTDPSSPTSTVRRGRFIDYNSKQANDTIDAVDQTTLDAKVARKAFEDSQIAEKISYSTGLFPLSSTNDVYRLRFGDLAINDKYRELSWSMELKAGQAMSRTAQRIVSVGV